MKSGTWCIGETTLGAPHRGPKTVPSWNGWIEGSGRGRPGVIWKTPKCSELGAEGEPAPAPEEAPLDLGDEEAGAEDSPLGREEK